MTRFSPDGDDFMGSTYGCDWYQWRWKSYHWGVGEASSCRPYLLMQPCRSGSNSLFLCRKMYLSYRRLCHFMLQNVHCHSNWYHYAEIIVMDCCFVWLPNLFLCLDPPLVTCTNVLFLPRLECWSLFLSPSLTDPPSPIHSPLDPNCISRFKSNTEKSKPKLRIIGQGDDEDERYYPKSIKKFIYLVNHYINMLGFRNLNGKELKKDEFADHQQVLEKPLKSSILPTRKTQIVKALMNC